MQDNTLTMTQNDTEMELVVTNKESGNSHMVSDKNWTGLLKKAINDTKAGSLDNSLNF